MTEASTLEAHEPTIRTLVHKQLPENVLVTGFRADGSDRFICTGRLPTAHSFLTDAGRTPRRDILYYTEVGRQASLAVSHAFLGVELDNVFIFERSTASVTEAVWHSPEPGADDQVVIEIELREALRRRNTLSRVVADHTIRVGGERLFFGTGTWTVQSASLFKRLRKMASGVEPAGPTPPPGSPLGYDATHAAGGVITTPRAVDGGAAVAASLIVDRTHPYFFDHPCDHVPGMLLLEGCAQLALAVCAEGIAGPRWCGPAIAACEAEFTHFVELDAPVTLTAHVSEPVAAAPRQPLSFDVVITQRGAAAGTVRLRAAFAA